MSQQQIESKIKAQIKDLRNKMPSCNNDVVEYSVRKLQEVGFEVTMTEVENPQLFSGIELCYETWKHILKQCHYKINDVLEINNPKNGELYYEWLTTAEGDEPAYSIFLKSEESHIYAIDTDETFTKISLGCHITTKKYWEKEIQKATIKQLEALMKDKCVMAVLKDINVDIKETYDVKCAIRETKNRIMETRIKDLCKKKPLLKYNEVKYALRKIQEACLIPTEVPSIRNVFNSKHRGYDCADICFETWQHILRQCHHTLYDVLKSDKLDDLCGENFKVICYDTNTSFKIDVSTKDCLESNIKKATINQLEALMDDGCVMVALKDINIDIKKIHMEKTSKLEANKNNI